MSRKVIVCSLALASCGTGAVAESVRSDAPTASHALGEAPCRNVADGAEPLIVDWNPELRGDLEVAMKDGVAVVSYSCDGFHLLPDCHIAGQYGFIGMTKREQMVRLDSSDEIKANLPFSGGRIGGELERGSSVDIALIMIGKRRTTWSEPTRADLEGKCDGATHYVRGATVGAFALESGSNANVRTAAELFGAGTQGASQSGKHVQNRDGDPSECAKSSPDAPAPPAQCGAPLRLVLSPIGPAPNSAAAPAKPVPVVAKAPSECPEGLVLAEGKCTTPSDKAPHQCKPGDADDCRAQCDRGHAGSCGELGAILTARHDAGARAPLEKACSGDDAHGCALLGALLATSDAAAAAKVDAKACAGGEAGGCRQLGVATASGAGVPRDAGRAAKLLGQACDGGDDDGCAELGKLLQGSSEAEQRNRAVAAHQRACNGRVAASCSAAGEAYDSGAPGTPKNSIIAEMLFRRGCIRMDGRSCADLGRSLLSRPQGGSSDEAKMYFDRACSAGVAVGCAALKVVFHDNRPVFPDVAEKQALTSRCMAGAARDCATSGLLDVASGNTVFGKTTLQRACTMGDAWSCSLVKQIP